MSSPDGRNQRDERWSAKMRRLRGRPLPEYVLRICDDEKVRQEATLAEDAYRRAQRLADSAPDDSELGRQAAALAEVHESAQLRLRAASLDLPFRALPRPVLEELITQHPPTEAQASEGAAFNPDTFPAALISSSSVDGMTESEAAELLGSWSAADANSLWEAAWQVQQVSRTDVDAVSVGKG
ncbi:hypothetical protein H9Y04_35280 [Streptomyces sp. TRM66268-LWL]|uniref:Uncharacterized protein n=1 Tax=Streptomyces polyasparticus TaxID=2767826 RepID=A0ABR7ST72_9ACTN|nr:hypothetical protein [Streptomyces polyasparticus]MBC9717807.1 hypothetical protein [Streptomyces polyasparticus]